MSPDDKPLGDVNKACPKCGGLGKEHGEIRASGGLAASMFDLDNKRFRYLSCKGCGYTEFYNSSISGADKIIDLLMS